MYVRAEKAEDLVVWHGQVEPIHCAYGVLDPSEPQRIFVGISHDVGLDQIADDDPVSDGSDGSDGTVANARVADDGGR